MKFKELDTVVLIRDLPGNGLRGGDRALSWAPIIRTDSMWSL